MAEFAISVLTNQGRDLIAQTMQGKQLKFSKFVIGSGILPEDQDPAELSGLIAPRLNMDISRIFNPGQTGVATISGVTTNRGLTQGFFMREIGLFAFIPDTDIEILYSYLYAGEKSDFIAAQEGIDYLTYRFNLKVIVDQAKNITAVFAEDPLNVSFEDLYGEIDSVIKLLREREAFLQSQIDKLAKTSIYNSIDHLKQNSSTSGQEA